MRSQKRRVEKQFKESFVCDGDLPFQVFVLRSEHVGDPLKDQTTLDEIVEANLLPVCPVKLPEKEFVYFLTKLVTKSRESLFQFCDVDSAGTVSVKDLKTVLPIDDILP